MPAPRLLDKRIVNQELALEKKKQIDSGLALAKKVDALREIRGEEEQRLADFREQSISRVKIEIETEIQKRDNLLEGNRRLEDERMILSTPIDLSQAWDEVKTGKIELTAWQEKLTQEQIEFLAKEEENRSFSDKLTKKSFEIERKEELAERTLTEAEQKHLQADSALQRAENEAQSIIQTAQQRDNHLKVREEDATAREVELSKREEAVDAHEKDLANREIKLKNRQEVFIRAQNYIKNNK